VSDSSETSNSGSSRNVCTAARPATTGAAGTCATAARPATTGAAGTRATTARSATSGSSRNACNNSETSNNGSSRNVCNSSEHQQQREQQERMQQQRGPATERTERINSNNTLPAIPPRRARTRVRKLPPNGAPAATDVKRTTLRYPTLGVERKINSGLCCKRHSDQGSRIEHRLSPTCAGESAKTVSARSLRQAGPAKADRTRPAPQAVQNGSCQPCPEGRSKAKNGSCAPPPTRRENSRSSNPCAAGQVWGGTQMLIVGASGCLPASRVGTSCQADCANRLPPAHRRDRATQERAAAQERHLPAKSHRKRVSRSGGPLRPDAQRVPELSGCVPTNADGAA